MKLRLWIFLGWLVTGVVTSAAVPGVSFEQRLGETLPLNSVFRATDGKAHALGEFFRGRPVVLWLGYARCPQLCSVVSDGLVSVLRPLQASAGVDFDVVMISIDPAETLAEASASRAEALGHYGRGSAAPGWSYLIGNAATIRTTAEAAGFHFVYDERSQQYAHPSGFLVLTPQGRISAYFPGVDFAPKDVAAAIARAGSGKIGDKIGDLLLTCFRGDGVAGRYGRVIWRTLGAAVALTVVTLASGIGWMLWVERRELHAGRKEVA